MTPVPYPEATERFFVRNPTLASSGERVFVPNPLENEVEPLAGGRELYEVRLGYVWGDPTKTRVSSSRDVDALIRRSGYESRPVGSLTLLGLDARNRIIAAVHGELTAPISHALRAAVLTGAGGIVYLLRTENAEPSADVIAFAERARASLLLRVLDFVLYDRTNSFSMLDAGLFRSVREGRGSEPPGS